MRERVPYVEIEVSLTACSTRSARRFLRSVCEGGDDAHLSTSINKKAEAGSAVSKRLGGWPVTCVAVMTVSDCEHGGVGLVTEAGVVPAKAVGRGRRRCAGSGPTFRRWRAVSS